MARKEAQLTQWIMRAYVLTCTRQVCNYCGHMSSPYAASEPMIECYREDDPTKIATFPEHLAIERWREYLRATEEQVRIAMPPLPREVKHVKLLVERCVECFPGETDPYEDERKLLLSTQFPANSITLGAIESPNANFQSEARKEIKKQNGNHKRAKPREERGAMSKPAPAPKDTKPKDKILGFFDL